VMVHRSGWSDEFGVNIRLAMMGIIWPIVMMVDWWNMAKSKTERS